MDTDMIGRPEYEEAVKRLEAEDKRQNARLSELENNVKQIGALTVSVEKLATNMETMSKELAAQNKQLTQLEERDGEMWRTVLKYAVTAVVGVLVGYALKAIGIF